MVVCGDGVVQGDEQCDDGNSVDNDDCSNACTAPGCGDGVVNFSEACDDGNDVNGDGCDTNCQESYCGNGIMAGEEECDDGNRVSGDGCDNNCTPSACGNGEQSPTEDCDDGNAIEGDGCDTNCTTSACGNGRVGGTESCDDGATMSGDGCSATCNVEQSEIEPNEDGTPSTGASGISGNDFATAAPNANGEITGSATISAAIDPAGDEDIFKVTNTDTNTMRVRLDTWNVAAGFDIGISCGSSIDTGMQVKNAVGTVLASNDNRSSSDLCAGLEYVLFPGDTVYVQVVETGDNAAITKYVLDVSFEAVICGDGDVGPGEQCDDMNTAAGDGCSPTCQIEGAVTEVEPNEDGSPSAGFGLTSGNDFGTAFPLNNGVITDDITILASLSPSGDEDIVAFANLRPNKVTVNLDVWNMASGYGVGVPCDTSIDTAMQLKDSSGTELDVNDDRASSADRCSTLTLTLNPGEMRFASVMDYGDSDTIPYYAFVINYTDIICGNGVVNTGEQCDDGNTMPGDGCDALCQNEPFCGDGIMQTAEWCDDSNMTDGDGCSSTCQVEGAQLEMEPNDDGAVATGGGSTTGNDFASTSADANGVFTTSVRIVGRLRPAGDEDVFAFKNPSATDAVAIKFNTYNNAPGFGPGVSCGSSIDTVIQIRDAAGNSLAVNDQAPSGNCSEITYSVLPGQTVYAQVLEYGDNAEIASYMLEAIYGPAPCGDGVINLNEQCDDTNITNGDGCSSTCQLENAFTEVEPNDDGTVNTSASGITGNDFSSANANGPFTTAKRILARLSPAGDEDVFKFNNPLTVPVIARFDIWNLAAGKGFGIACGTTINPGLHIRDASGTSLISNDDRNGSTDRCSGLTYTIPAGATVYAHVMASGDNSTIASYVLDVRYTPIICGDSIIMQGEQCDDGNALDGDGCSSTCQYELVCGNGILQAAEACDDANSADNDGCSSTCTLENQVTEVEPNDTSSDADTNPVQISGNAFISGAITSGNVDRYKVTVATATAVRFETFTAWGDCSSATIDLRLFDSTGTPIVSDLVGSGIKECGAIVMFLDAGTYYVQVEERGNNAAIAAYLLQVAFQTSTGMETEPNETTTQASTTLVNTNETFVFGGHMMNMDTDVYAVTVPSNGHIRAEVIEGNRAAETCEAGGVDSRIFLLDETGVVIADDNDSGRGLCSLIDGTGSTPLDAGARNGSSFAKTYYVVVQAAALTTSNGQFDYRLQITVR